MNLKLKRPADGSESQVSRCDWTESFKRFIHSGTNQRDSAVSGIIIVGEIVVEQQKWI